MLVTCMRPAFLQAQPVSKAPRRQQRSSLYRCVRSQASADEGGITRREGLAAGLGVAAATAYSAAIPSSANAIPAAAKAPATAPFELPPLPYAMDALEPIMSKMTLEFHWGKHHAAYVANLNNQIKGNQELERLTLQEVMLKTWNGGNPAPAFNNAAQVVNHTFFWESMKPNGGGQPSGQLLAAINRDFGSFDAFKQQFKAAGATQFGSGWAWLVLGKDGKLKVTKTANAENPWLSGETPILTVDVWEHAYYLDVQNRRPDFLASFVDSLIDWDRVAARYSAARKA